MGILSQLWVSRLRADHQAPDDSALSRETQSCERIPASVTLWLALLYLRVSIEHRPPRLFIGSDLLKTLNNFLTCGLFFTVDSVWNIQFEETFRDTVVAAVFAQRWKTLAAVLGFSMADIAILERHPRPAARLLEEWTERYPPRDTQPKELIKAARKEGLEYEANELLCLILGEWRGSRMELWAFHLWKEMSL